MAASYDEAVAELYQAPHASFVSERKRLAGEVKTAGDKVGATRVSKLGRPPISAWAVNQLWWHAREAFDKLLATATQLRDGDLGATSAHREALAALRARAATLLTEAGNAATEATLRRAATTLSAIAANGGFDPDPPGALSDDRDPPGFEAAGIPGLAAPAAKAPKPDGAAADPEEAEAQTKRETKRASDAEEARERSEAASARRRAEEAAAKKIAERHRAEAALRTANGDIERRARDVDRLRKAVEEAEAALDKAKAIATDLEAKLEELGTEA